MMNHKIALSLAAISTLALAMPAEARINQRQDRQQHRIVDGVQSGSLNKRETVRLTREQLSIARYEARSRADGPGLTPTERLRIEQKQDRASRHIYRQKRD
jgi:hypothetical protein